MKVFGFIAVGSVVVLTTQLFILVRFVQNLFQVILKIVRDALHVFTVSLLMGQHRLLELLEQLVHFEHSRLRHHRCTSLLRHFLALDEFLDLTEEHVLIILEFIKAQSLVMLIQNLLHHKGC